MLTRAYLYAKRISRLIKIVNKFFDKNARICYHYNKYMKNHKKLNKTLVKSVMRTDTRVKNQKEPDVITKIIFYLAISDMAQNVKESWASLLPYMSENQRQRLSNILEASFLDAATRGIDEKLREKLKLIEQQYARG